MHLITREYGILLINCFPGIVSTMTMRYPLDYTRPSGTLNNRIYTVFLCVCSTHSGTVNFQLA